MRLFCVYCGNQPFAMFMKKLLSTITLLVCCVALSQNVYIPDAAFKAKLLSYGTLIDTNGDGEIQITEAQSFQGTLNVNGAPSNYGTITNLTGIEYFTEITALYAVYNHITSLNLSQNTKLTLVNVDHNDIAYFNVDNGALIQTLRISNNQISSLNLSNCTVLTELECNSNLLTLLDLSANTLLTHVACRANLLTSININNCPELLTLYINYNQLTAIDVSHNPLLTILYCDSNSLTALDVTANLELTDISCASNNLTQLDITHNLHLYSLFCFYNNLLALDLSASQELVLLSCGYNPNLTELDFSHTPAFKHLNCLELPVTELDFSLCPELNLLVCSRCPQLKYINLKNGNNSDAIAPNMYIADLPSLETICVDDEDSYFANLLYEQFITDVDVTDICALSTNSIAFGKVVFSPNPVSNTLYITGSTISEVMLYNSIGQTVGFYKNQAQIDFSGFSNGMYLVHAKDSNGAVTIKSIVKGL